MTVSPSEAIEAIQRSIDVIPATILAIIFLAGPTLAWLLYRFVVLPRTSRYSDRSGELLWLCSRCRSANEARTGNCYRCGLARSAITGPLHLVDGDDIIALPPEFETEGTDASPAPPVPAPGYPGRSAPGLVPGTTGGMTAADLRALGHAPTSSPAGGPSLVAEPDPDLEPLVAVGPGRPAPIPPTKIRTSSRTQRPRRAAADATVATGDQDGHVTTNGHGGANGHRDADVATTRRVAVGPGVDRARSATAVAKPGVESPPGEA